jgi:hypothetical protein
MISCTRSRLGCGKGGCKAWEAMYV